MAILHQLNFEDYKLDRQATLDTIPGKSRGFIEDTLDDLMEDWEDQNLNLCPYGQWMELPLESADGEYVKVGTHVYEDAYLAEQLKGSNKAFIYYIQCSDAMVSYCDGLDDALDTLIMNYALIEILNKAFEGIVEDLAEFLPDYCSGCLEVPGVEGRWSLLGNKDIANSFIADSDDHQNHIELQESGLNKNRFSQLGLIFTKMPDNCTGAWRKKMSIPELCEELRVYSGH